MIALSFQASVDFHYCFQHAKSAAATMPETSADRGEYAEFTPDFKPEQRKPTITRVPEHNDSANRSWRAPVTIILALVVGLGIALAHHAMGLSLHNRPVDNVGVSQAWIFRFATALAFLVKVAFATGVGNAYVQHQWLRLRQQPFRTNEVDALTSVLGSIFGFISSTVWFKHPILALMALITWYG